MKCPFKAKVCIKCKRILIVCDMNFPKRKSSKDGFRNECKECRKKYSKQYREEHKEELLEYSKQYREENKEYYAEYMKQYKEKHREELSEYKKQYREENKEYYAEYMKQYREENKEEIAEYMKQYREENKEEIAEYMKQYREENKEYYAEYYKQYYEENPHIQFNNHNKRRQLEENQGNGISKEQWLEMMIFFNFKCAYSGEKLSSKEVRTIDHIVALNNGGLNEIWNCVPMCRSYNTSKHTKDMEQWYRQQEYFSEERLGKIYAWIEYAYEKWGV